MAVNFSVMSLFPCRLYRWEPHSDAMRGACTAAITYCQKYRSFV
jgi:hypothetical protein